MLDLPRQAQGGWTDQAMSHKFGGRKSTRLFQVIEDSSLGRICL